MMEIKPFSFTQDSETSRLQVCEPSIIASNINGDLVDIGRAR